MTVRRASLLPGVEPLALGALVAVATTLLIGDFGVRLAASTADDSPVLIARFLVDPSRFRGDILQSFATVYGLGTLVHWGPALLLRWLHVSPETSSLLLVYLQNVLLALAVRALARAAGAGRAVAWAAALFTLAVEVYLWNLANYRSQMQVPYAGHLVLALITFAAAAILRRRDLAAALTLVIAALVHPTVTLLAMPAYALGLLLRDDPPQQEPPRALAPRALMHAMLVFLPAFIAAVGVALIVRTVATDPLAPADLLQAMRANVHMNPLGSARFSRVLLPAYGAFLLLLALALRQRTLSSAYRRLLLATTVATALYALAHVLALRAGWTIMITLVPLRFTMVLALLAVPALTAMLIGTLASASFAARWAAAALLVLLPLGSLALHWPALVALTLVSAARKDGRGRAGSDHVALGLLLLWATAVLAAAAGVDALARPTAWLRAGTAQDAQATFGAIAIAALLAWLWHVPQRRHQAAIAVAALCAVMLLIRNAAKGADTRDGHDRDLYAAQLWARDHSPVDAVFIVEPNVPWRVISERRALPLWPNDAHVYSGSRAALAYAHAVRAQVTRRPFTDTTAIVAFRHRFGGNYLVREAGRPALFPPVYRNDHFAIYRLPGRNRADR